jgi:hypothetical protein
MKNDPASQTPVFPKTLHQVRPRPEENPPVVKTEKRDNIFSQSRDVREDRGERQIKTESNPQTFTHNK